jgi:flagellar biosynthesis GTPase FlhF
MAKSGGAALEAEVATAAAGGGGGGGDTDDSDDDDDGPRSRKDQKKADKKAEHREQVAARNEQREAIKEREAELEAKRKAKEQRAEERERAREERERLEKEAAEKRKQEELDKWASMFSVEETGEEGADAEGEDEATLLSRFVEHIRACKVNVLEELGGEFGLKTSDVIQRVRALEAMGHLSGVIDDRGKFICITPDEMRAVAKFVQRKGRVRISTLAQESNKLIDLTPRKTADADDEAVEEEAA